MHLIVCSNSGPARPSNPDEKLRAGAAGGLLPHLLSMLDESGGDWFFPDNQPAGARWPERARNIALHPLSIGERQRRLHYETISIETLLWLFHYLHDTVTGPTFDSKLHEAWAAYRQVNGLFAERLAAASNGRGHDAVVLVNDYHFLLLPGILSGLKLPAGAKIIYSHQVPWCEPAYFGILPSALREQILTSLLSCHTVVFHASQWAEAFSRCCDRYLPTAKIANGIVRYHDRLTRLVAAPLPLDARNLSGLQHAEATWRWRQRLDELARGRRLLLRVDRLDLWKNHVRGFAA